MHDRSPHGRPTRRTLLAGTGVALTALAGCLEGDDSSNDHEARTDVLADDRIDVPAGDMLAPQFELQAGDTLEYRVRKVDGARPTLRLETDDGEVLRDHAVAEVIDDAYTLEEGGRYYVYAENTAFSTTGVWDYTFKRVSE